MTFKVDVVALNNVRVVDVCPKAEGYPRHNWELSKYHEEEEEEDDDDYGDVTRIVIEMIMMNDDQLRIIRSTTGKKAMT